MHINIKDISPTVSVQVYQLQGAKRIKIKKNSHSKVVIFQVLQAVGSVVGVVSMYKWYNLYSLFRCVYAIRINPLAPEFSFKF
jgi:hypothetical protein